MLTTVRDAQGQLVAACEWWRVDCSGTMSFNGAFVWISQLDTSRHTGGTKVVAELIRKISELAPDAIGAYWQRRDTTGEKPHQYTREQLTRFVEEVSGHATV